MQTFTGLLDTMVDDGVVAIEWAERLGKENPAQDMVIHFSIKEENTRDINITGYGQTGLNLLKGLGLRELPPDH